VLVFVPITKRLTTSTRKYLVGDESGVPNIHCTLNGAHSKRQKKHANIQDPINLVFRIFTVPFLSALRRSARETCSADSPPLDAAHGMP
jgi:hypothetical protein